MIRSSFRSALRVSHSAFRIWLCPPSSVLRPPWRVLAARASVPHSALHISPSEFRSALSHPHLSVPLRTFPRLLKVKHFFLEAPCPCNVEQPLRTLDLFCVEATLPEADGLMLPPSEAVR